MAATKKEHDVEKGGMGIDNKYDVSPIDSERGYGLKDAAYTVEADAVPGESFARGESNYAKIQRFAGRFGIEQRGIERVPENERTDKGLMKVGTMVGGCLSDEDGCGTDTII